MRPASLRLERTSSFRNFKISSPRKETIIPTIVITPDVFCAADIGRVICAIIPDISDVTYTLIVNFLVKQIKPGMLVSESIRALKDLSTERSAHGCIALAELYSDTAIDLEKFANRTWDQLLEQY